MIQNNQYRIILDGFGSKQAAENMIKILGVQGMARIEEYIPTSSE